MASFLEARLDIGEKHGRESGKEETRPQHGFTQSYTRPDSSGYQK